MLLFLFPAALLLPDRVDCSIGVLGMDSPHNGACRSVFLYLKCVTGSDEHWRLICILHWDLQTHKHLDFLKHKCIIVKLHKQTQSVGGAANHNYSIRVLSCLFAYFNVHTFIVASSL